MRSFTDCLDARPDDARRTRRHRVRPAVDRLETRDLKTAGVALVDGTLHITGTPGGDWVGVVTDWAHPDRINVQFGSAAAPQAAMANPVANFARDEVMRIVVEGGDGNDVIGVIGAIPVVAYGGAGDDSLTGGAGDDSLDGGSGNDVLFGGAGGDSLNGGDGNDMIYDTSGRNMIEAGAGVNTITTNAASIVAAARPNARNRVTIRPAQRNV